MKIFDNTLPRHFFRIALDEMTVVRLLEIADEAGCDPTSLIAAIIHDVLEDDALAHEASPNASMTLQ